MTHICDSKQTIIGSDHGLSPGRRQAIIWTNAGILLIRTLGTNFSEILSEIHSFSFSKMHLKMSSATWRLFGLGLNELNSLLIFTDWPTWCWQKSSSSILLAFFVRIPSVIAGFSSQRATNAESFSMSWYHHDVWSLHVLTHWGRVTHICVGNLTIIGSGNGLSPGRRQAITWINAGLLLIGPLRTNFNEILFGIQTFSFKKMHLKMSSGKWRPSWLSLNVLITSWLVKYQIRVL